MNTGISLKRYFPVLDWLTRYQRSDLSGDVLAGVIVAIMLVPQAMAYAMLAGLPPQVGLYASIVPLLVYGLLGTSRTLAVGPVALVSLMAASSLSGIAAAGTAEYITGALVLALMSGAILLLFGVLRFGVIVNFLSHPVISGFTSAAALVIGFSQLKHLLGIEIPRSHLITDTIAHAIQQAPDINVTTLAIGLASIGLLLVTRQPLERLLIQRGLPFMVTEPVTKAGPLFVVVLGTLLVWGLQMDQSEGVNIVGAIPAGLPMITVPAWNPTLWQQLFPAALLIAFVGFLESVSVAKSLASKRRQRIDPDQELIALGMANVGSALTGGYPVTGGFSRSVVNFSAGAKTPFASMITAGLVAVTVLFLTPLFYYLPRAVLAAIIFVAVFGLLDIKSFQHAWRYNKGDAISLLATFVAVLLLGVEFGILFGLVLSVALFIWRTSQPHIAIVGRVGNTEQFRNIKRHDVRTCADVLAVRVDGSLYFANSRYLEDYVCMVCGDRPELKHLVLVGSAINFIDASALETLESLVERLRDGGVTTHLAQIKGPVMDQLENSEFLQHLLPGQVFLSTHEAMRTLNCV